MKFRSDHYPSAEDIAFYRGKQWDNTLRTKGPEMAHMDDHPTVEKLSLDPWAGRSTGMICRFCMFFVCKEPTNRAPREGDKGYMGRCRRHAPLMTGFPVVFEVDWCGDHKMDENA